LTSAIELLASPVVLIAWLAQPLGACASSSPSTVTPPVADGAIDDASDVSLVTRNDASIASDARADIADALVEAPGEAARGCDSVLVWTQIAGSPGGVTISGSSSTDIWLLGQSALGMGGVLMRGDGTTWTAVRAGDADVVRGTALWVSGPNDVLVGARDVFDFNGNGEVQNWDGVVWQSSSLGDHRSLSNFWGTTPTDVWGSSNGSPYLGRWNGRFWEFTGDYATGPLAGGARGDFWAANDPPNRFDHHSPMDANVFSYDKSLNVATLGFDFDAGLCSPDGCIHGGWASATDDVWFVGEQGVTFHFDGAAWTLKTTPVTTALRGIWGSSRNDVWAVGDGGALLHFDGTGWSQGPSLTTATLESVWTSGPCDVWIVGDAVYHGAPRD
jgi:hypothetical protein